MAKTLYIAATGHGNKVPSGADPLENVSPKTAMWKNLLFKQKLKNHSEINKLFIWILKTGERDGVGCIECCGYGVFSLVFCEFVVGFLFSVESFLFCKKMSL